MPPLGRHVECFLGKGVLGDVYVMPSIPVVIRQEEDVWVLRIEQPNGSVQEYRCLSELQAKQLAAMLLTPREQPSP